MDNIQRYPDLNGQEKSKGVSHEHDKRTLTACFCRALDYNLAEKALIEFMME